MQDLRITSITAAVLGLIFIVLTARVGKARGQAGASLGDGSGGLIKRGEEHTAPLLVASRSHANFAEYVPLCLILMALLERGSSPAWFVGALGAVLVVARILHPIGMGRASPNLFRASGATGTILVLAVASIGLLVMSVRSE